MSKAVINGKLVSVSASQIKNWQTCARRWWFEKVAGFQPEQTPQQAQGELIHHGLEQHLKHGAPLANESSKRAVELINAPRKLLLLSEYPRNYKLDLTAANVPVKGRIDLLDLNPIRTKKTLRILDFKTAGSFDYNKTEEELARDVQMMIYAKWAFQRFDIQYVQAAHIYIHKKQTAAKIVETEGLDEGHVSGVFQHVEALVDQMQTTAAQADHNQVEKDESACYAYGKRCPFFDECHSEKTTVQLKAEKENVHMDFVEKLRARATGVEAPAAETQPTTQTGNDLILYIDCVDTKLTNTLRLEDEIARRTPEVLKQVAAKERRAEFEKLTDVREVPYGAGTAGLLVDFKKNPPTGDVYASSVGLSAQVLEVLTPLAKRVIRSTR